MAVAAHGRRREAKTWLADLLADGPVAVREIQQAARNAGLSWMTIRRSKDALSVVPSKDGYQGAWQWSLAKDAHSTHQVSTFDPSNGEVKDAQVSAFDLDNSGIKDAQVSTFEDAHHANVSAFEETANVVKDDQLSAFEERDGRPEHLDIEAQATVTDGRFSLSGKPWQELGVSSLPARDVAFVALVQVNPRVEGESLVTWTKRISAACDSKNIFYPRAVHARVRDLAAAA